MGGRGRKSGIGRKSGAGQPFIVLTGLSGSGKSQAIRALEDLGYFCVDNLPTTLIPTLAKLSLRAGGDIEKVAIVVDVRRRQETILIGTCPELTRHHMELRGLGVINITELFGIASTRSSKRVELVVQLERWDPSIEYERLGLDDDSYEILGLRVPLIRMPVAPGRNIAILVEVAARNQLLKARGHHAARALADRLEQTLRQANLPAPDEEDEELEPGGSR